MLLSFVVCTQQSTRMLLSTTFSLARMAFFVPALRQGSTGPYGFLPACTQTRFNFISPYDFLLCLHSADNICTQHSAIFGAFAKKKPSTLNSALLCSASFLTHRLKLLPKLLNTYIPFLPMLHNSIRTPPWGMQVVKQHMSRP